jgi:hypothetical protein
LTRRASPELIKVSQQDGQLGNVQSQGARGPRWIRWLIVKDHQFQ